MFSFLNQPLNQRFGRLVTTFFSNFGGRVLGIVRYSTYGPAICRIKDTVIATFKDFSISILVFNKIGYSFAMSAVFSAIL